VPRVRPGGDPGLRYVPRRATARPRIGRRARQGIGAGVAQAGVTARANPWIAARAKSGLPPSALIRVTTPARAGLPPWGQAGIAARRGAAVATRVRPGTPARVQATIATWVQATIATWVQVGVPALATAGRRPRIRAGTTPRMQPGIAATGGPGRTPRVRPRIPPHILVRVPDRLGAAPMTCGVARPLRVGGGVRGPPGITGLVRASLAHAPLSVPRHPCGPPRRPRQITPSWSTSRRPATWSARPARPSTVGRAQAPPTAGARRSSRRLQPRILPLHNGCGGVTETPRNAAAPLTSPPLRADDGQYPADGIQSGEVALCTTNSRPGPAE
jgi:hypothetical protein